MNRLGDIMIPSQTPIINYCTINPI